jgi:hypothetical protein
VALAQQIAGTEAGPEREELARRIAEAYVDLRRTRGLRHELICRALSDPDYDSRKNRNKKVTTALRVIRRCSRCEDIAEEDVKFLSSKLPEPDRFATVFAEIARWFPALDRYERRALSRLNRAIRDFDVSAEQGSNRLGPDAAERHSRD